MRSDKPSETVSSLADKSPLEQALAVGLYGPPELKRDEKLHYLGEFRERVIRVLSRRQVAEPVTYGEIATALQDKGAAKLLINGRIPSRHSRKYERLAQEQGIPTTIVHNAKLKGNVGLAVVANDAVDVEEVAVLDRRERLGRLGLPKTLIDAVGGKVCVRCLKQIEHADPSELTNYNKMIWADRLFGISCQGCAKQRQ